MLVRWNGASMPPGSTWSIGLLAFSGSMRPIYSDGRRLRGRRREGDVRLMSDNFQLSDVKIGCSCFSGEDRRRVRDRSLLWVYRKAWLIALRSPGYARWRPRDSRYDTTEWPQTGGEPASVSPLDAGAFAPIPAVRAAT